MTLDSITLAYSIIKIVVANDNCACTFFFFCNAILHVRVDSPIKHGARNRIVSRQACYTKDDGNVCNVIALYILYYY